MHPVTHSRAPTCVLPPRFASVPSRSSSVCLTQIKQHSWPSLLNANGFQNAPLSVSLVPRGSLREGVRGGEGESIGWAAKPQIDSPWLTLATMYFRGNRHADKTVCLEIHVDRGVCACVCVCVCVCPDMRAYHSAQSIPFWKCVAKSLFGLADRANRTPPPC